MLTYYIGDLMKTELQQINKLAKDIVHEVDGLLEGEEPEPTIFRKARKIVRLSSINKE